MDWLNNNQSHIRGILLDHIHLSEAAQVILHWTTLATLDNQQPITDLHGQSLSFNQESIAASNLSGSVLTVHTLARCRNSDGQHFD